MASVYMVGFFTSLMVMGISLVYIRWENKHPEEAQVDVFMPAGGVNLGVSVMRTGSKGTGRWK